LLLAEDAHDGQRRRLLDDAAAAMRALWSYLTPEGVWRDKRLAKGGFINEAAPASTFYHIMSAFTQLEATGRSKELSGLNQLSLQ
jgi:mannose/cellobiose epimerase-like protein (N-acyl-D-glucosamine 2-epimerase family)